MPGAPQRWRLASQIRKSLFCLHVFCLLKDSDDGQNEQKSTICGGCSKSSINLFGCLTMKESDDGQNEQKSTICGGCSKSNINLFGCLLYEGHIV